MYEQCAQLHILAAMICKVPTPYAILFSSLKMTNFKKCGTGCVGNMHGAHSNFFLTLIHPAKVTHAIYLED
jgi:hypothetical protein